MSDRDHITSQTVNLGMIVNIMLSIAKTVIGILGHSQALLADGINSVSDVIYYIAVKIFMSIPMATASWKAFPPSWWEPSSSPPASPSSLNPSTRFTTSPLVTTKPAQPP